MARHLLPLPLRRIAGAQRGADLRQRTPRCLGQRANLRQRHLQVLVDVVAQRFERRHVDHFGLVRQRPLARPPHQARRCRSGTPPAFCRSRWARRSARPAPPGSAANPPFAAPWGRRTARQTTPERADRTKTALYLYFRSSPDPALSATPGPNPPALECYNSEEILSSRGCPRMAEDQDISRRDLLKTAGAVAAVAAVSAAPAIQKVQSRQRPGAVRHDRHRQPRHLPAEASEEHRDRPLRGAVRHPPDQPRPRRRRPSATIRKPSRITTICWRLKDVDAVFVIVPLFVHFPLTRDALHGRQARVLREVPGVQAGGGARPARAGRRRAPSRCCRPACSGATATSTRP